MKKIIIGLFISILLVAISCEPPVVFKSPQPKGIIEITSFSKEFRGTFIRIHDLYFMTHPACFKEPKPNIMNVKT